MRSIAFLFSVVLSLQVIGLFAQTTQKFNYQAVIRDNDGELITNQQITVKLTIIETSENGDDIYKESHEVTTTEHGLISLMVGDGTADLGTFSAIEWGSSAKFIKVEIDIGNGFIEIGTFQLLSVPYANYAIEVENKDDADPDPSNEIQNLNLDGSVLTITDNPSATEINLAPFTGNNTDEQILSLNDTLLSISGGNTISVSALASDADSTNEIQDLYLTNNVLTITNNPNPTEISLASYLGNNTDEQVLSLADTLLSISGGNTINVSSLVADSDSINEIQDILLVGTELSITSGSTLDLSVLQDGVNDADTDPTNEIQTLTIEGDTLEVSGGNQITLPYDSSYWAVDGSKIYYNTGNVGIGSSNPVSNLEVKANAPGTDALFQVINANNDTVFAVYPDGVKIFIDSEAKGKIGGFAVSGRNPAKAGGVDIMKVTVDSTRIYVNDTVGIKGKIGGFAVSGRNPAKGTAHDYFLVTGDSTRVYVNEETGTKGKIGGFAVSGRNPAKGTIKDYLQVTKDSTRVYIEESTAKGKIGGFAVSGRNPAKGTSQPMFVTTIDSTRIYTQDTIGGFGVYDNQGSSSSSYMHLTPLNYFIGHNSGQNIEYDSLNPGMGKYNTFFGYETGANSVSGFKNIFMGYRSGYNDVGGGWNIFIGNNAGFSSTGSLSNICIGDEAGYSFTNGINNIFIGKESGYSSTENVYQNVFIGNSAGKSNISGGYNVYLGISAGYNALGSNNAFLGNASGFGNTGSMNTLIGSESGIYSAGGTRNVYIGYKAGYRSYGTRNVFIGTNANNTNFSSVDYSNCIAIGDSVIVTGDNQIRIGNSSATSLYLEGAHNVTSSGGTGLYINSSGKLGTVVSSKRYKKDIVDLEINTSDIYKLRPVSYTLKSDNERYFGLIAEEVAEVIPNLVEFVKAKDVIPNSTSNEMIPNSVHYPILSVLLLNEIQRHQKIVENQTGEIAKLKKENEDLKMRLIKLEEIVLNK